MLFMLTLLSFVPTHQKKLSLKKNLIKNCFSLGTIKVRNCY